MLSKVSKNHKPKIVTWSDIADDLDGYQAASGSDIDREIAEKMVCRVCGEKRCRYEAYRNSRSYRAFAVCGCCGNTVEF